MSILLSFSFLVTLYWQYQIFQSNEILIKKIQQVLIHQESIKLNLRQFLTLEYFEEKEMLKSIDRTYKFPRIIRFCSHDDLKENRTELSFFVNRDFKEVNLIGEVLREGIYFFNDENLILLNSKYYDTFPSIQKIIIYDQDNEGLPLSLNNYHIRDQPCFD